MSFVSHLECSLTGERYEAGQIHGLSKAGRPLLVRYDLGRVRAAVSKRDLALRGSGMWRYRELLPMAHPDRAPSLGEDATPMIRIPKIERRHGGGELFVKDESRLPTGSFKARGLALAVAMAKEFGIDHLAMPTNGNAGAALSAYASRAGLRSTVFCPDNTPEVNVAETALQGADVWRVNGLINDCGKIVAEGKEKVGWFDVSTLKEPYRIEGKKTMGLEIADQFGWEVPDVILFPTGGGTAVIGMWKAFQELADLGWIGSKRPRMAVVQATGCAPLVKAWEEGAEHAPVWPNARTIAAGIRVPVAIGDFLILRAVRESNGFCMAVEDADMLDARAEMAKEEGLLMCPEGAAAYAAVRQALKHGLISKTERVVFFNCATGLKYPMPRVEKNLDRTKPIDYGQFR
jgi:threonine synthase